MTHEFKTGDYVRFKGDATLYRLDINPNPDYEEDDECWADMVSDDYSSTEIDSPDDIEFVMSESEAANRKLPTASEVLGSFNFLDSWGPLRFDEVEPDGDGALIYGNTDEGLRFVVRVVVDQIERTDY